MRRDAVRALTRLLAPGPPIDARAIAGDAGVYFGNDDLVLAGRGRAAVLPLPNGLVDPAGCQAAVAWLAALESDNPVGLPGTGPVAFGALPFEIDAPSALIVPSVLYGRTAEGSEWVTVIADDPLPVPSRQWLRDEIMSPRRLEHISMPRIAAPDPTDYRDAVARAIAVIDDGRLRKVALARRIIVGTDSAIVASAMLERLAGDEPSATAFLLGRGEDAFVGASPEVLVSRRNRSVLSHPLAGTIALEAAADSIEQGDRLLGSAKDLEEHELVVADIAGVLDPLCSELVVPGEPSLVPLRTMAHLGTRIEGRLIAEDGRVPSALELVSALHPTPAVGGVPRPEALRLIAELEPGPRGPWAGPVGWVDASGDGDWMVGLRSATVSDTTATNWAGAGIVAASDPEAELAETTVKLAVVLEGLAPGASALLEGYAIKY
jgi:menaquinone-specific isochorismate synthase